MKIKKQDKYPIKEGKSLLSLLIVLILYLLVSYFTFLLLKHYNSGSILIFSAILLGFIFQWTYNAAHDCIHLTYLKNHKINDSFGVVFSTLTLLNFNMFRAYHWQHHKHTFSNKETEPIENDFSNIREYLVNFLIPLFWVDNWVQSFNISFNRKRKSALGKDTIQVSKKIRRLIVRDGTILTIFTLTMVYLTFIAPFFLIFFYWLPLYISLMFNFFFLLPEHYGVDHVAGKNLQNVRTTRTNPLVRFFICNVNYHGEHHIYPTIPNYYLPEISNKIGKDLKFIQNSYFLFHLNLIKDLVKNKNAR